MRQTTSPRKWNSWGTSLGTFLRAVSSTQESTSHHFRWKFFNPYPASNVGVLLNVLSLPFCSCSWVRIPFAESLCPEHLFSLSKAQKTSPILYLPIFSAFFLSFFVTLPRLFLSSSRLLWSSPDIFLVGTSSFFFFCAFSHLHHRLNYCGLFLKLSACQIIVFQFFILLFLS